MIPKQCVLVTGAPRSGTTFAGSVMSFAREVDYIHEPFNPQCGMKGFHERYPYTHEGMDNQAELDSWIRRLKTYRFQLRTAHFDTDPPLHSTVKSIVGGRGVNSLRVARLNPFRQFTLIKDPFACLLADYLSRAHGVKSLVLIRHPIAFVAGVRRMKWDLGLALQALAAKPELVQEYFRGEERLLEAGASKVENAARAWRALNKVLLRQAAQNSSLKVMTHEKLSAAPVEQFKRLYDWAGLPWREAYKKKIIRMTSGRNRVEAKTTAQDFNRYSAELLAHRLAQVPEEECRAIWEITKDVAGALYERKGLRNGPTGGEIEASRGE